jgi:hypothetical protein
MREVDLAPVKYTCADVIKTLILEHQRAHTSPLRDFQTLDIVTSDLPEVVLRFRRDCLVHFRTN